MGVTKMFGWLNRNIFMLLGLVCAGLALFILVSLFLGNSVSNNINRKLDSMIKKGDPETREKLTALKNEGRFDPLTLLAMMSEAFYKNDGGRDGLQKLAHNIDKYDLELRLTDIAVQNINNYESSEQRGEFLLAHYTALAPTQGLLQDDPDITAASKRYEDEYISLLKNAQNDPETWRRVRENPVYVLLLMEVKDKDLLDYYEKEKDWLDAVITIVTAEGYSVLAETDGKQDEELESLSLTDILTIVKKNDPYLKNALKSELSKLSDVDETESYHNATNLIINLFDEHGMAIAKATEKGIPLEETVSVLLTNKNFFSSFDDEKKLADKLIEIKNQPTVWECCTTALNILEVTEKLHNPDLAQRLCEKFGDKDIGTFLYTQYPDEIPQAAEALDKFGNRALGILAKYSDSPDEQFRKFLRDNTLGARIVPYVMIYGDSGLAKLNDNKAWLDKYFDEEGNEKEPGWWGSVPLVGGVTNVAANWVNGYPNTWGELGWAALDVADGVILFATLGASSPVTATKAGTTNMAKKEARDIIRKEVRDAVNRRLKEIGTEKITTSLTKKPPLAKSLFTRVAQNTTEGVVRVFKTKAGKFVIRTVATVGKFGGSFLKPFATLPKATFGTWKSLSPQAKRLICRSVIAGSIIAELIYKTIPATKRAALKVADYIGRIPGKLAETALEVFKAGVNGFIDEGKNFIRNSLSSFYETVAVMFGFFVLSFILFVMHGKRKQKSPLHNHS